ncbi:MAG: hypothetical protein HUU22_08575 [Phycisphaerae bacterium]|nr:hypothetical protein [Phycisphaerae bacterium]NUQ46074.1 hypothetical protein [Phycisphaerae bacterium]
MTKPLPSPTANHTPGRTPRAETAAAACFVIILLVLLLAGRSNLLRDPGTFWHTVVGERILQTADFPTTDEFTFTHFDERWIAQQWLAECAMAALYRIGGLDTLLLASAAVIALVFTGLFRRLIQAGLAWPAAALILALTLAAASYHFHARPHLMTLVFSATLYAMLCNVDRGRSRPIRLVLLIPLFIVWSNCHGGALGGLATLMLAATGWSIVALIAPAATILDRVARACSPCEPTSPQRSGTNSPANDASPMENSPPLPHRRDSDQQNGAPPDSARVARACSPCEPTSPQRSGTNSSANDASPMENSPPLPHGRGSDQQNGAPSDSARVARACSPCEPTAPKTNQPSPGHAVAIVWAITLPCLATPLINPYGLDLPRVWTSLMRSDALPRIIVEHAPPAPDSPEFWTIGALLAVYLVSLLAVPRNAWRVTHLLPAAWAILAYSRVRHGPIFAVMTPIALAELLPLARRTPRWLWRDHVPPQTAADTPTMHAPARTARFAPFLAALPVLLALGLHALDVRAPLLGTGWARLNPRYWPVESLAPLREALAEQPDRPNVFNDMRYGGFIIRYAPEARVFIDDRCELFADAGLRDYVDLMRNPARIEPILEKHHVRLALVRRDSSFDRWFASRTDWHGRHANDTAVVYERPKTLAPPPPSP